MKILIAVFVGCLLTAQAAFAQIEIKLVMENTSYLQYETINAVANLKNTGQRILRITGDGSSGDAIEFTIIRGKDTYIDRKVKARVVKELTLEPGEQRDIMVNLTSYYDMTEMGQYKISLEVSQSGRTYSSGSQLIDIVAGLELKTTTKSVYGFPDEMRKFSMRYWARGDSEDAFLKITDESETVCYGVFSLGRIIRVTEPKMTFDPKNDLYIVHQRSKDCFVRSKIVVEKNNVALVDQAYFLPTGEPFPLMGQVPAGKASQVKPVTKEAGRKTSAKPAEKSAVKPEESIKAEPPKKKGRPSLFYFRKSEAAGGTEDK